MLIKKPKSFGKGLVLAAVLSGCVENRPPGTDRAAEPLPAPPPLWTEPIVVQITRAQPRLADGTFRVLLDFERPTDLAFVQPSPPDVQLAANRPHTGAGSLRLEAARGVRVKLGSLVTGTFPGDWCIA